MIHETELEANIKRYQNNWTVFNAELYLKILAAKSIEIKLNNNKTK